MDCILGQDIFDAHTGSFKIALKNGIYDSTTSLIDAKQNHLKFSVNDCSNIDVDNKYTILLTPYLPYIWMNLNSKWVANIYFRRYAMIYYCPYSNCKTMILGYIHGQFYFSCCCNYPSKRDNDKTMMYYKLNSTVRFSPHATLDGSHYQAFLL